METELSYLTNPLQFEFEAKIIQSEFLGENRFGVVLDNTFFYPTGGGQEHDTGLIGEAIVSDVYKGDNGKIIHVVDRDLKIKSYKAKINNERRILHMQHHSAQHILSHAFQTVLGAETISVKIQGETPSTIDIGITEIADQDLIRVENYANEIIFDDLEIKSYFIEGTEVDNIPFRRPPTVTGAIRVIEVDSLDYSACGGTHCPRTGMIGVVKVIRNECIKDKLRVYFLAGRRALRDYQESHYIVSNVSKQLSVRADIVIDSLKKQLEQQHLMQEEVKMLRAELIPVEAQNLLDSSIRFGDKKLIIASFRNRPTNELRQVAMILKECLNTVSLLAGYDGQKLSLVVACSDGSGMNAKDLLTLHLAELHGKCGGDKYIAQGGGQASESQFSSFFDRTKNLVEELK